MSYHLQNLKTTFLKELLLRKSQAFSFVLYRTKWHLFPKFDIIHAFPLHVDIETTSRCNLRCTMCIQSSSEGRKNQGDIDFNMACRILEAIGGKVYSVKFNWRGEPLLYQKLPELIRYAKQCKIPEVQINTNGTLLTADLSRKLIDAGLDRIIFSVDGYSSETYEKIRIGGNYRQLMKNIGDFLYEKDQGNSQKNKRPFVRIQIVVGDKNKHEVDSFVKYWEDVGISVGLIDKQNRIKKLNQTNFVINPIVKCKQPWQRLTISWQGKVFGCCADWYEKSPFLWKVSNKQISSEKLQTQLSSSWREGKVISQIRQTIRSGDFTNSFCVNCPFVTNGE